MTPLVSFYNRSESLLFQFLIHEVLQAAHLLETSLSLKTKQKLVGSKEKRWFSREGHLPLILHFCELQSEENKELKKTICRAQDAAQDEKWPVVKEALLEFGRHALETLPRYKESPHVLYFLLTQHDRIDRAFGKTTTLHALRRVFGQNLESMANALIECMSLRGFQNLSSQIIHETKRISNETK